MNAPRLFAVPVATALALVVAGTLAASDPQIAPIQSHPHGHTYAQWAAAWWQWALQTPADINPVLDQTGAHCAVNQTDQVWFLAGLFSAGTVTRTCTIPTGTALFVPLANAFYGAFLTDPPEQRTEAFVRSQVSCIEGATVAAEIDGVAVANPQQYLEMSPLFTVQLPPNNVFGVDETEVPELTLEPSVDEGFYLFAEPLPPGMHTIQFHAAGGCAVPLDVTYHLTVAPGGR